MKISLIIPTYRREELLVQTLRCALKQDFDDYEILVVDQTLDHNADVKAFLDSQKDRITRIVLETPSLTKARNVGLRNASGDVLIFIDDDTTFEPDFLTQHHAAHQAGAMVVQGRVMEKNARIANKPLWVNWRIKFKGSNNCKQHGAINTITGCNFSIRREAVETTGYFDERFVGIATREDSEYGLRAHRSGLSLRFAPLAAVFHHRSDVGGVATGVKNQFFDPNYYTCELLFAKRHFSAPVVWLYKWRLRLRGQKQVRNLVFEADERASVALDGDN